MPHCDDCGVYAKSLVPLGLVTQLCTDCADVDDDE